MPIQLVLKKGSVKRYAADVVFCLDLSKSMMPCIQGIIDNIKDFIGLIKAKAGAPVELRLGFVGHQWDRELNQFYWSWLNYTKDVGVFLSFLAATKAKLGWDETNLVGLDVALDFEYWCHRNEPPSKASKFVMMFTDEPVETGWEPAYCLGKVEEIKKKIRCLGTYLTIVSYDDKQQPTYKDICSIDRCKFIPIPRTQGFMKVDFADILKLLSKTVYSNLGEGPRDERHEDTPEPCKINLFGLYGESHNPPEHKGEDKT
jgi:hypothetical protein